MKIALEKNLDEFTEFVKTQYSAGSSELAGSDVDQVGEHIESIMCERCGMIQDAVVLHTWPFYSYLHECPCGFIIGESEWNKVEPNAPAQPPKVG